MNKKATRPTNEPAPKKKPVNPDADYLAEKLQQALRLLKPLTDFHKSADESTSDDLRIYWDVRIVRGPSTAFAHVQGSTSMPQMVAPKRTALAASAIETEIQEKIIRPLIAIFQTEAERVTFEGLASRAKKAGPEGELDEQWIPEPPAP